MLKNPAQGGDAANGRGRRGDALQFPWVSGRGIKDNYGRTVHIFSLVSGKRRIACHLDRVRRGASWSRPEQRAEAEVQGSSPRTA